MFLNNLQTCLYDRLIDCPNRISIHFNFASSADLPNGEWSINVLMNSLGFGGVCKSPIFGKGLFCSSRVCRDFNVSRAPCNRVKTESTAVSRTFGVSLLETMSSSAYATTNTDNMKAKILRNDNHNKIN